MAFYENILKAKPTTSKGMYMRKVAVSPSMGPSFHSGSQFVGGCVSRVFIMVAQFLNAPTKFRLTYRNFEDLNGCLLAGSLS